MPRTYAVIDADAHVLEPVDLWLNYIDPKFKKQAPQVLQDDAGKELFQLEEGNIVQYGASFPSAFASVGGLGMREGNKPKGTSYLDGRPGGFDPHRRIPDMD